MKENFSEFLHEHPIIAAISDEKDIDKVIDSPSPIVFLLKGDIITLQKQVARLQNAEKCVFIHFDLMDGFAKDVWALEFIVDNIKPDGIITTRQNIIQKAKDFKLFTIQRIFMLDSMAFEAGIRSINQNKPDAVEIIPGLMPSVIEVISKKTNIPIVTGGLIRTKQDVISALNAGALAVSSSSQNVWYL